MSSSIRETVPIISVITPVYNSEKYLDEAVQSVLKQSFTEWELLLINDGSTDGSGELCDRYLNLDKRIRVFHIENGGYGRARNLGLDNAEGEWVTFLDSDDHLAPGALQNMLNRGNDSDLVMALYQTIPEQTMLKEAGVCRRFETLNEMSQAFSQLYEPYFFLSVCSKLYRKTILKDKFDFLSAISMFYFTNLILNIVLSFFEFKKSPLFAIGLLLFLGCDIFVGLQVANGLYINIPTDSILYNIIFAPFNISWLCYLPSQTLISSSVMSINKNIFNFKLKK